MQIIDVNDLFQSVNDIANKDQTGAAVSPEEFNRMMGDSVHAFVRKCYGLEDNYREGMPMPKISYEITQLVVDYLSKLKVAEYKMAVDKDGKGVVPDNYLHNGALRYLFYKKGEPMDAPEHICCDACADPCEQGSKSLSYSQRTRPMYTPMNRPVKIVTEAAYEFALCSVNRPATKEYPIAVFRDEHLQFAPNDLKQVLFTYLRYPKKPVFAYDIDATTGAVIFKKTGGTYPLPGPSDSVDIELPLVCKLQVAAIIARRMGFFTRDAPLIQTTQNVIDTGL